MTSDKWGALGFVAVYLAIKIIDYILPPGHHFRLSHRWAHPDDANHDDHQEDTTP